jgi:hypothetical protein
MRRLYWRKFYSQAFTRTHLVKGRMALCGEVPNWETYREDESGDDKQLCSRCRKAAKEQEVAL